MQRAAMAVVLGVVAGSALAHPYGWRVNQSADGTLQMDFLWERTHKAWTTDPAYEGIIDNSLAFEEVLVDRPSEDIYQLPEGVKIAVVVDSFDAGVLLRDAANPENVYAEPGDSWGVGTGGAGFFTFALWQIDPTLAGFDPDKGIWEASFHIVDLSGQLERSQTHTFLLEPSAVPAPGVAGLVGVGGVFAGRRRRR